MTFTLAMDILLVGLLLAAVAVGWRLEHRLRAFRAERGAFEEAALSLQRATTAAAESIEALRAHAAADGAKLEERLERARLVSDDLGFLAERAERIATRLERVPLSGGIPPAGPAANATAPASAGPAPLAAPRVAAAVRRPDPRVLERLR